MTTEVLCHWEGVDVSLGDVLGATERLRLRQARTATRASVINLVVVVHREEAARRAKSTLDRLGAHHPGRTVVIVASDGAPSRIDASVELSEDKAGTSPVWWETVVLDVGGPVVDHLDSLVDPLLLHDLRTVAWYPDAIPAVQGVPTSVHSVILGPEGGPSAAAALAAGRVVADTAWLACEPQRRALASAYRGPGVASVKAGGPGRTPALLAGWVCERLGLPAEAASLEPGPGPHIEVVLGDGRVEAGVADTGAVHADAAVAAALGSWGRDGRYDAAVGFAARAGW
ncbi:MAG TPA: glucose-6-phosphate dehydrogenase assembly protein OpcA [Acidimicrobiales bacterium]|nr:glucose-6-phosphate dehydrogenase assembly protein OpcA [Acidimicrobiales bacterium]